MKSASGLASIEQYLYGVKGDTLWSFRKSNDELPRIAAAQAAYSAQALGDVILYGIVRSSSFVYSSVRDRLLGPEDSLEKRSRRGKVIRVLKFPLGADGRLREPSAIDIGPPDVGAYPLAAIGSTIFAGTDREVIAVSEDDPARPLWRTSLPGWRLGFRASSDREAFISTVSTDWTQAGLWRLSEGRLEPVEVDNRWRILCLDIDKKGRLWAAATSEGRNALLLRNAEWIVNEVDPPSLVEEVEDLAVGKDGSIWCATISGVVRFRQGKWIRWTASDGIGSNFHNSVLVDDVGVAWFWSGISLDWATAPGQVGCAWIHPDSHG